MRWKTELGCRVGERGSGVLGAGYPDFAESEGGLLADVKDLGGAEPREGGGQVPFPFHPADGAVEVHPLFLAIAMAAEQVVEEAVGGEGRARERDLGEGGLAGFAGEEVVVDLDRPHDRLLEDGAGERGWFETRRFADADDGGGEEFEAEELDGLRGRRRELLAPAVAAGEVEAAALDFESIAADAFDDAVEGGAGLAESAEGHRDAGAG